MSSSVRNANQAPALHIAYATWIARLHPRRHFVLLAGGKTLYLSARRERTSGFLVSAPGMRYWTECRAFFGQFRRQYHTTGSILPSSRALGRALTKPMRQAAAPRRILEIGPGTGAVTREIVRSLRPG